MLRIFFLCFLFAFIFQAALSQTYTIRGKIADTTRRAEISEASVIILKEKDSMLVNDARTDQHGNFVVRITGKGRYLLLVTYPTYAGYTERLLLDSLSPPTLLKNVVLTKNAVLLSEVIIKAKKAITIKGDTTEFDAGSFKVKPNATVEDLLKQLPGLVVDKSGKIMARGKKVDKVLVDGEEFFGDDPTLITQNLKADIIDKVQLYEKTSDQAALSGVDDGHKSTTIDLKVKKERKFGQFGKVELGGATRKFYQNQATYNRFNNNEKFAAYLMLSNTGNIGVNREAQRTFEEGEDISVKNELDNWNGTYNGEGIPKVLSGGVHYDNKWNDDRESVNANYKLGHLDVSGNRSSIIQNNLPGNPLYVNTESQRKNELLRNTINAVYRFKIDPTSELKVTIQGAAVHKRTSLSDSAVTTNGNFLKLNSALKNVATQGQTNAVYGNFLWQKKFRKERRSLSLNLNTRLSDNNSSGNFYTQSIFFNNRGTADSTQLFDQLKKVENRNDAYSFKAIYAEPLNSKSSLVINLDLSAENATSSLNTFNKTSGDAYSATPDSLYSNNYQFDQRSARSGVAYLFTTRKLRVQAGTDIESKQFRQQNLFVGSRLDRSFINWYPRTVLQYNLAPSKSLSFNYRGNNIQPSIQQLQPVLNNNDPLNIYVGNVLLRPSFNNAFTASYQMYKGSTSLDIRGNYDITSRPITLAVQTDEVTGKSVITFVNLNSKTTSQYSANFLYRNKLKSWNLDYGADGGVSGSTYATLANGQANTTHANTYNLNFIVSKAADSLYYLGASLGGNYNVNNNSLRRSLRNNSLGYTLSPYIDFYFHKKWRFHTDAVYTWQGKTETFPTNFSRLIWNISLEKQVIKKENVLLRLSANDILNQNLGFNRSGYSNIIAETRYTTVSRYVMVSLIWDFNKMGTSKK